jgi:hypothetical protein
MSTAQTIVNEALGLLNLNNGFKPVDPRHQQVGFQTLVDLLIKYRGDEIYLTPQIPATITAEINEKPAAKLGLVYDLAFYISAPLQVREFPATFSALRKDALDTLYINFKPPTTQQYPELLPIGGGNEQYADYAFRFYGEQDLTNYQIYDQVNLNESQFFYADFDSDATLKGTTVSSVAWEVLDNAGTQISNESLTGNTAKALLTFQGEGLTTIKATATYANSEVKDFMFNIQVVMP